jgi:hypothetical protein
MSATNKPAKYSAEQIEEIIGRILTLRTNWLRVVEARLASRQSQQSSVSELAS